MKILVTGSRGFIGTALSVCLTFRSDIQIDELWLEESGYIDFGITKYYNRTKLPYIINNVNPDYVFHLAANPLVKTENINQLLKDNVQLTYDILDAMGGGHIIYTSSATIYGDGQGSWSEHHKPSPTSLYGFSKLASENLIQAHALTGRIKASIFRLGAVVGGGSTHGLLHDVMRKHKNTRIVELIGNRPGSTKPYTHVSDIVNGLILGMKLEGIYNLSVQDNLSVLDVANHVNNKLGKKELKWLGESANWVGDNKYVRIDSNKLIREGWNPLYSTSLEAINHAIDEYNS